MLSLCLGGQTYQVEPGKALCDLRIIDGKDQVFILADALSMLMKGKNPYALVQNWNQLRNLCRVYNPEPTVEAVTDFAQVHNLISRGLNDAAIPGISKEGIERAGGKPAPQYGVGALATPRGVAPPNGYTTAAEMPGGNVIVPESNKSTAQGAFAGSLAGTKAGANGISVNALEIYKGWSKEASAASKGIEGGSALLAGLQALKASNPYIYGAMIAFFTHYAGKNIASSNVNEYFASLAGIALARLVSGKKDYKSDSEGAKIGVSVNSNTPADFAKLQVTLRGLYASFRVSSKGEAYQLSNQAYSERRINESDLTAMHEVFDILYSETGLAAAQKLMSGKDKGIEIASDKSAPPRNAMIEYESSKEVSRPIPALETDVRAKNRAKYANQAAQKEEASQEPVEAPEEEDTEVISPPTEGGTISGSV